jgi:peptidyl-prolyl cis-trans isomerase A (cyclophilin A)
MRKHLSILTCLLMGGTMTVEAAKTIAVIETSKGTITCELFDKQTPITVANFVDLATAKKEWTDPNSGQKKKSNFYDGLIFHRVIPNFMIQGGDPVGNGTGGPGYRFQDEIVPGLVFDKPGKLAMANAGPGTNGSQFFITVAPAPWLNGRHTIFGAVTAGYEVVEAISKVDRDAGDRPKTPVVVKKVTLKTAP